jgi:hypothetical protein
MSDVYADSSASGAPGSTRPAVEGHRGMGEEEEERERGEDGVGGAVECEGRREEG